MRIIDTDVLAAFRRKTACEWCGEPSRVGLDPHHFWFSRGASRLDHPWNLISLCRPCHNGAHAGAISRVSLLAVVAKREGKTPETIELKLIALRNRRKP